MPKTNDVSCETFQKILLDNCFFSDKSMAYKYSEKVFLFWKEFSSWNKAHNLSTITDFDSALYLHFLDSLYPVLFNKPFLNAKNILDLGTGGGFPGIPLSIFYPEISFHLLDKSRKKISFLRYVSSKLSLSNVYPSHKDFFKTDSTFDIVVSRAVRIDQNIFDHISKSINKGGWLIIYRTRDDNPLINKNPSNIINYSIFDKKRSIQFFQF